MHQYTRRNNVEIASIPKTGSDNVLLLATVVGNAVGFDVNLDDIDAAHRVLSAYNVNRRASRNLIVKIVRRIKYQFITRAHGELTASTCSLWQNYGVLQKVCAGEANAQK